MFNSIVLKGSLIGDPYYDIEPVQGTPFMRFYLAVDMATGLAHTFLHGFLAQPPYFDRIPPDNAPFLRFYLRVPYDGNQKSNFIRCVAYGKRALLDYQYLRPASEILVKGNLRTRRRRTGRGKRKIVVEVLVDDEDGISFIDNIDYDRGNRERERINGNERFDGTGEVAGGVFRVISFGDSAKHDYPYLQKGSEVFVMGHVQTRKRQVDGRKETVVEVVTHKTSFLRNINWERGHALNTSGENQ